MEENKRKQDLEDEMTRLVLLFSFFCACRSRQIPGNFLLLIKWSENLNLDR